MNVGDRLQNKSLFKYDDVLTIAHLNMKRTFGLAVNEFGETKSLNAEDIRDCHWVTPTGQGCNAL